MELTLNIYEKGEAVKTYKTEGYDIMFGTVNNILQIIDVESLLKPDATNEEFAKLAANIIKNGFNEVKSLLKEVFPGLTEEELNHTKIKELGVVLIDLVKYSIKEITGISTGKN